MMFDSESILKKYYSYEGQEIREMGALMQQCYFLLIHQLGQVTLNWTVFKRTVTIENQEMR